MEIKIGKNEQKVIESVEYSNTFKMDGVATVKLWNDDIAEIEMASTTFSVETDGNFTENFIDAIICNLNDNGSGVEEIQSAVISVCQILYIKRIYPDGKEIKTESYADAFDGMIDVNTHKLRSIDGNVNQIKIQKIGE